jgi:hypothetical protein
MWPWQKKKSFAMRVSEALPGKKDVIPASHVQEPHPYLGTVSASVFPRNLSSHEQ